MRKAEEDDRIRRDQRSDQDRAFERGIAAHRSAVRPDEQQRRDDQRAERVAEPPHGPERGKSGRRLHASRAERDHADRRADHRADNDRSQKSHDVADARQPAIEGQMPQQRRPHDRFERVANRDSHRHGQRLIRRGIGQESADQNSRNAAPAEAEDGGDREAGGGPDRRYLRGAKCQR